MQYSLTNFSPYPEFCLAKYFDFLEANQISYSSVAAPITELYTTTSFSSNITLLGAILKERRIEFLMEGRRWADIHRLQNDPNFPVVGVPAKAANGGFSSAPTALAAYTLGTPYSGVLGVNKFLTITLSFCGLHCNWSWILIQL